MPEMVLGAFDNIACEGYNRNCFNNNVNFVSRLMSANLHVQDFSPIYICRIKASLKSCPSPSFI